MLKERRKISIQEAVLSSSLLKDGIAINSLSKEIPFACMSERLSFMISRD